MMVGSKMNDNFLAFGGSMRHIRLFKEQGSMSFTTAHGGLRHSDCEIKARLGIKLKTFIFKDHLKRYKNSI